ncbi:tyrosine-type recombinase/integrase [Yoonia sp. TsM2_T14_4]|uniref:tyrosine-type recombinase/integrase n=1 Tax=Yoonia sp. TsM2_T14_4 TaxID=3415141 RepID=UPI003C739AF0
MASIDVASLQKFDVWRTEQMGRKAAHSTINTHNSALNRVLDEAELRGWITGSIRPTLLNKGRKAQKRGAFSLDEYQKIYTDLRTYHEKTFHPGARETREVMRNYVLFLANTGIRHGTEALNLKWSSIAWVKKGDERFLAIYPSGKTGPRLAIARDRTERFLDRQRTMNPALVDKTLDEVIEAKTDDYVFKTRSDERIDYYNLARNFNQYLEENDMKIGQDRLPRTLYSFRHFYVTQDLARGVTSDQLSSQLGNSAQVVDRYYSKLSPLMNAELHSGRAFVKKSIAEDEEVTVVEAVALVAEQPALSAAAAKAFDMFDAGKIGEAALLAALGVSRQGYSATDAVTVRALASVEAGTLAESMLIKIITP